MTLKTKTDRRKLWSYFDLKNKKHMAILSRCIQYGWSKDHPVTGKEVANLGQLDAWLRGKSKSGQSPVKKPLAEMDTKELSLVISALDNMILKKYS